MATFARGASRGRRVKLPLRSVALIACALLLPAGRSIGYPWPFRGGVPDPQNPLMAQYVQQQIRTTIGSYRYSEASSGAGASHHFHSGVDIVPTSSANTVVYTVDGGVNSDGIASHGLNLENIVIGNIHYVHVRVYHQFDDSSNPKGPGHFIMPGTPIGELVNADDMGVDGSGRQITPHCHLWEESAGGLPVDPLQHLTPFLDARPPIVESVRIFRNPGWVEDELSDEGGELTTANERTSESVVYGKIDILAKGYDLLNENTYNADYMGHMFPQRMGYEILNHVDNSLECDRFSEFPSNLAPLRFRTSPKDPGSGVRLVHYSQSNDYPEVWLTTRANDGKAPVQEYWNSRLKRNQTKIEVDARADEESVVHDGKVIIRARMADAVGNANNPGDASDLTKVLDNYLPFRKATTIGDSTKGYRFQDGWTFNAGSGKYEYPTGGATVTRITSAGDYPLRITFSEQTYLAADGSSGPKIEFDGAGEDADKVALTTSGLTTDDGGITWTGAIHVPAKAENGDRRATIIAHDLAGNRILGLTEAIAKTPFTQPSHTGPNEWTSGPSNADDTNDTMVKVRVCVVEFAATIDDPPAGSRVCPITLTFNKKVTNVRANMPENDQNPISHTTNWKAEGTEFKGTVDLGNVCMNGQPLCLKVRVDSGVCTDLDVSGIAGVPIVGDDAVLDADAVGTVTPKKYPQYQPMPLHYSSPVMNLSVEPTVFHVTNTDGTKATVFVSGDIDVATYANTHIRWSWTPMGLTYKVCFGEAKGGINVDGQVPLHWKNACEHNEPPTGCKSLQGGGCDSTGGGCESKGEGGGCLCGNAYASQRDEGSANIQVHFTPEGHPEAGAIASSTFLNDQAYTPVDNWNTSPAQDPALAPEPGSESLVLATIVLVGPGTVEAAIEGLTGVAVTPQQVPGSGGTKWQVVVNQPCDVEGTGVLKIRAFAGCKGDLLKINYRADSQYCTKITGVYKGSGGSKVYIQNGETVKAGEVIHVEGTVHKDGGQIRILASNAAPVTVPVEGTTAVTPCRNSFDMPHTVAGGQTVFVGLNKDGKGCGYQRTVNADPTFMTPGESEPPLVIPLPRAYLSPAISPGVQDTAEFVPPFGGDTQVTARLIDSNGVEVVQLLADGLISSGASIEWDGKNAAGDLEPDGEYALVVEGRLLPSGAPVAFRGTFIVDNTPPEAGFSRIEGMPLAGEKLTVVGTAFDGYFAHYKLTAFTSTGATVLISEGDNPARNGRLGMTPATLPAGEVLFVLTVTDLAGNTAIRYRRLTVHPPDSLSALRVAVDVVAGGVISGTGQFVPDNPDIYVDDSTNLPTGSTMLPEGGWEWVESPYPVVSGRQSHTDAGGAGHSVHYLIHADEQLVTGSYSDDLIIQYVYVTGSVQEIMVQFYTGNGDGEHRAYWGLDKIQTGGVAGTASFKRMGDISGYGKWLRLKIPARDLGVEGVPIKGIAFHAWGVDSSAKVYWDKTTTSTSAIDYVPDQFVYVPNLIDDYTQWTVKFTPSQTNWIALDVTDTDNKVLKRIYTATPTGGQQQSALWDGTNDKGDYVPNGIYFFQFRAREGQQFDCDRLEPVFAGSYSPLPDAKTMTAETSLADGQGNTWAIEASNPADPRVVKRNAAGGLIVVFDQASLVNPLEDFRPVDLTFDPNGSVYVLDQLGQRLLKLSSEGTYLGETKVGLPTPAAAILDTGLSNAGNLFVGDASGMVVQVSVGRGIVLQSNIVAEISLPENEAVVRGIVPIIGTATARNFRQYTLSLSRSIDGAYMRELVRSTSKKVASDQDYFFSYNGTVYGDLGYLNSGRDEYAYPYAPAGDNLNGVYTIKLKVEALDGRSAEDRKTVIVGRLVSAAEGGTAEDEDGTTHMSVPVWTVTREWEVIAVVKPEDLGRNVPKEFPLKGGMIKIGPIVEIRPPCLKFNNPVTMTMKYNPADLATYNLLPTSLSLYAWDSSHSQWKKMSSSVNAGANSVSAQLDSISCSDAVYGLFADPTPPSGPVLVQPATPTVLPQIPATVLCEPLAHVRLMAKHEGDAVFVNAGEADADPNGIAKVEGVVLAMGANVLKAVAIDPAGNESPESNLVAVERVLPAVVPQSVAFRSQDFTQETGTCCVDSGMVLGIQLQGTSDPAKQDVAVVRVYSSFLDPNGIEVPLTETTPASDIFQGTVSLGAVSDASRQVLAAGRDREIVGVVALGATWVADSVQVADLTPPAAPVITSSTHPSLMQATFETGKLEPLSAGSPGVTILIDETTTCTGHYCARPVNVEAGGAFKINLSTTPYSLTDYPILSFDYNIPAPNPGQAPVQLGLWVDINKPGTTLAYHFQFTEKRGIYFYDTDGVRALTAGSIPGVVADGNWHHVELDLKTALGALTVNSLFFANMMQSGFMRMGPAGENPAGATFRIDNVLVTQAGSNNLFPQFAWEPPADSSGIAGYGVVLDASQTTDAPEIPNVTTNQAGFSDAELRTFGSSDLFVHVRAVDGAGNAGLTNHYRIRVDAIGPIASNPNPPQSAQAPPSEISCRITDPGGSGVDMDGIRLRVNDVLFTVSGGGFSFDAANSKLTFKMGQSSFTAPIIVNGQPVTVTLEAAPDKAGNPLQLPLLSWTFYASFDSFARGQAVLLTIAGGRQPAWSPDARTILYTKDTGTGMKLFTIDSTDVQEKNATVRQITQNPPGAVANDTHPAWAPSGSLVAFEREVDGQTDIYMLNLAGGSLTQITDTASSEHHPTWSPDGQYVVYEADSDIWKVRILPSVGGSELLRHDVQRLEREPFWMYGSRILYRDALYVDNVRVFDPATGAETGLTSEDTESQPAWSSSGQQVGFVSRREGGASQLWVMNADGAMPKKLLDNPGGFSDTEPAFAPDGSAVAFESTRSGIPNIWLLLTLKLSPLLARPPAISPKNADGLFDRVTLSYTITADAMVTVTVKGPGVNGTLSQDRFVPGGLDVFEWDGKVSGAYVASGSCSVTIKATSPFGGDPIVQSAVVKVDNDPPTTLLPAAGSFVRLGAPVGIWTGDPGGGGVKTLFVREGSNPFKSYGFTQGVTGLYPEAINQDVVLSDLGATAFGEGSHSLQARAVDGIENGELVKATSVIVDAQPPRITVTPDGPVVEVSGRRFARSSVTYTVDVFDDQATVPGADSGIREVYIGGLGVGIPSRIQFKAEGANSISVWARDKVLWATTYEYSVTVDDSPPSSTAWAGPSAVSNGTDLYVRLQPGLSPTLTVTGGDTGSGVARVETRLYLDGIRQDGGSGTLFVSTPGQVFSWALADEGRWRVEFRSVDNLEISEAEKWFEVVVTSQPLPGVMLSLIGPQFTDVQNRRYVAADVAPVVTTVRLEGTDASVLSFSYRLDSGLIVSVTRPVDGSSFSAEFTLAPGRHAVDYYGIRDVSQGGEEVHGTAILYADASPPTVVSLLLTGSQYVDTGSGKTYMTGQHTAAQVVWTDPPIVGTTEPGSSVDAIRYSFNGGSPKGTMGPISFAGLGSGDLSMLVESVDRVGNLGSATRSYVLDDLSPATSVAFVADQYLRPSDNKLFMTHPGADAANHVIANLVTADNDGGAGVKGLSYSLDALTLVPSVPFVDRMSVTVLSEGTHTIRYRATDNVQNSETPRYVTFYADFSPPATTVTGQTPSAVLPNGDLYLGAYQGNQPAVGLNSSDSQGAGVKAMFYSTDGSSYFPCTPGQAVGLPGEGTKTFSFFSVDLLNQYETIRHPVIRVDQTPPAMTLDPQSATLSFVSGGITFVAPGSGVVATAADPLLSDGSAGSGVSAVSIQVGTLQVQYTSQATLTAAMPRSEGAWSVVAIGKDRVENAQSVVRSFTIDLTAPVTVLTPLGAFIDTGVAKYSDVQTSYLLNATDLMAGGNTGSGVREISCRVMSGGTVVRPDTVTAGDSATIAPLPTGTYTISWFGRDRVGNTEAVHTLAITVVSVGQVPTIQLVVTGPQADLAGTKYVRAAEATGASTLSLRAVTGATSTHIRYHLDAEAVTTVPVPEALIGALAAGPHTLSFRGVTIVGESETEEVETVASLVADRTPPQVSIVASDTKTPLSVTGEGYVLVRPSASITVTAFDPAESSVAGSGVATLFMRLDGGISTEVGAPLRLTQEGSHTIATEAADRVGLSRTDTFTVRVDGSAPATTVQPSGALVSSSKGLFATADLSYAVLAQDGPLGAESGVDKVFVKLDGGSTTQFYAAAPIRFSTDGIHTIQHWASDRLGTTGNPQTFSVTVDTQPPTNIVLTVLGPSYIDGTGRRYGSVTTAYGATATDAGVGLSRLEIRQDDGNFALYSVPVTFAAEGAHVMAIKAFDLVGNASAIAAFPIATDVTAPTSVLAVDSGPSHQEVGVLRVTSATKLGLAASDPIVTDAVPGSGVKELRFQISGQSEQAYSAAFQVSASEGTFAVTYYSRDNVFNREVTKLENILVDNTGPAAPAVAFDTSSGSVVLSWVANTEPDLAGYRVYRRVDGGERVLLSGPNLIPVTTLTDAEAAILTFASLTYEVEAVDVVDNASVPGIATVAPADLKAQLEIVANGAPLVDGWFFNSPALTLATHVRGATSPKAEVWREGLLVATSTAADFTTVLSQAGGYSVTLTAVRSGVTLTEQRTFTIDLTPPAVTVRANGMPLASGAVLKGPVLLEYEAQDLNLAGVNGILDGAQIPSGVTLTQTASHNLVVTATDRAGNSTVVTVSFSVDVTPPAVPAGLAGTVVSATSARLTWTPNAESDLAGYRVWRDGLLLMPDLLPQSVNPVEFLDVTIPLGTPQAHYQVAAVDQLGQESDRAEVIVVFDVTPPVSTLVVGTPRWGENPATTGAPTEPYGGQQPVYVAGSTLLALTATDDVSGVDRTEYRFDPGQPFATSPLSFTGGTSPSLNAPFALEYRSADVAGNVESIRTATLFVDTLAPSVPALTVTGPTFTDTSGTRYGSALTTYAVSSTDPGAGLDRIEITQDGGAAVVFASPVSFPAEGEHVLGAVATDRVGNQSGEVTFPLVTDATAPATSLLVVSGPSVVEPGDLRITSETEIAFPAVDPAISVSVPGSGLKETFFQVGALSQYPYVNPVKIAMADGPYPVTFFSRDNVLNQEVAVTVTVFVDNTAPEVTTVVGTPQVLEGGVSRVSGQTPVTVTAADPAGVAVLTVAFDSGAAQPVPVGGVVSLAALAEGPHTLAIVAVDGLGNSTTPLITSVVLDNTAPAVTTVVGVPQVLDGGVSRVSGQTPVTVTAADPAGVASLAYAFDGEPLQAVPGDGVLSLSALVEGSHTIEVVAIDELGNSTTPLTTSVFLDNTAPVVTTVVGTPQVLEGGVSRVTGQTPVTITSADPAGVASLTYAFDGGAALPVPADGVVSLAGLTDGPHAIAGVAVDGVENSTTPLVTSVVVDNTAPAVPSSLSGYAQSATSVVLIWASNTEPDLAGYRVSRDGILLTPSLIAPTGSDTVQFEDPAVPPGTAEPTYTVVAVDTLGHPSDPATVQVVVDVTPPVSTLVMGTPRWGENPATTNAPSEPYGGQQPMYLGAATPVELTAIDDVSGVSRIEYRFGGTGPFVAYVSPLAAGSLPSLNAVVTIDYRSVDAAGNTEQARTATVFVDTLGPVATMSIGTPSSTLFYPIVISRATPLVFSAADAGAGVSLIDTYVDGSYAGGFDGTTGTLFMPALAADGVRIVSWRATDRVENAGGPWSRTVTLDSTAPTALITGPGAGGCMPASVTVTGTATDLHFVSYLLDYAAVGSTTFAPIAPQAVFTQPVTAGALAAWSTTGMVDGDYVLRLTVNDAVGNTSVATSIVHKGVPTLSGPSVPIPSFQFGFGGVSGTNPGQYRRPWGIAIAPDGRIYVTDYENDRVQVHDAAGNYLFMWGRDGSADGNFGEPNADAISADGKLYVVEKANARVSVFDLAGNFLFKFGTEGSGAGQLKAPHGIAVSQNTGRVYVGDTGNKRISVFNSQGSFLFSGFTGCGVHACDLNQPFAIALDCDETVYVADREEDDVKVFSSDGTLLRVIGGNLGLEHPQGIVLSNDGTHLYVTDAAHRRVVLMDKYGVYLGQFGSFGGGDGQFGDSHHLCWDPAKQLVFVADSANRNIQAFGFGGMLMSMGAGEQGMAASLVLPSSSVGSLAGGGTSKGELPGVTPNTLSFSVNPFDPRGGVPLTVLFDLGTAATVSGVVTDRLGNVVAILPAQSLPAGSGSLVWDGLDTRRHPASPGTYIVTVTVTNGSGVATRSASLQIMNYGGNVPGGSNGSGQTPRGRAR